MEAAEHAVADVDPRHGVARGDHRADELVADREARLDLHPAVVDVEVRAADAGRLDAHDRVVGREQLGLRALVEPDLPRRLEGDRAHPLVRLALLPAGPHQHLVDATCVGRGDRVEDRLGDVLGCERLADLLAHLLDRVDDHRVGVVALQLGRDEARARSP